MERYKGLFVILDANLFPMGSRRRALISHLASALKDFRSMGYRVVGVVVEDDLEDSLAELGFQFDSVERVEGDFAPVAWSVARRLSLNVKRSLLCSADVSHANWAQDAGLRRFMMLERLLSHG
ncbi:MAG: hypothetical protein CMH57_14950 [Myxococcales bacterium]|nr:hypothetical protein [Myxococcales bacterium]